MPEPARHRLDRRAVRRLALVRAGLLRPEWAGLPVRARGRGKRASAAIERVIRNFGYLQLDTVPVAGARSHALVLLSRIEGLDPDLPEELLQPGSPWFEYWGHEACWLPLDLYPAFAFRRAAFRERHWYSHLLDEHPGLVDEVLARAAEGPFRSADLEGSGAGEWWGFKLSKRVAAALWSCGELAIRERRNFHRSFDLPERVIPDVYRRDLPLEQALPILLLHALDGHGWATTGTLADTWRLKNLRPQIQAALQQLQEEGEIVACDFATPERTVSGWIRVRDLELAERARRLRPRRDVGLLLSPFDPVLWDRARVQALFGFDQVLEIFKPAAQRVYGYYCLPVLAGDRLVARYDLKAHKAQGRVEVLQFHLEEGVDEPIALEASRSALDRYASAVGLALD